MPINYCENCDQETLKACLTSIDDKHICDDCLEKNYTECFGCQNHFLTEKLTLVRDDEYACKNCYKNNLKECSYCHNKEWENDLEDCSECRMSYCGDCNSDNHYCNDEDGARNQQLKFKEGKDCKTISAYRFIGVELEAELQNDEYDTDYTKIKLPKEYGKMSDGSLSRGIEVTTPPSKGLEFIKSVKLACDQLKKNGYGVSDHCGTHVHIDLRDKQNDFKFIAHLMITVFAIEDMLYAVQPKKRLESHYCQPIRKSYQLFDFYGQNVYDFDYKFYKQSKDARGKSQISDFKRTKWGHNRYHSFNFHSVFFRGSLEVRMQAGSLNPIKIARWCQLLQQIILWVDYRYNFKPLVKLLLMPAGKAKLKKIKRLFKLSDPLADYLEARMKLFKHEGLKIPYSVGTPPKRLLKNPKVREIAGLSEVLN